MLKKCLSLFITGIILIAIGGIGLAALAMNGINLNGISIGPSSSETSLENVEMCIIPIDETEEITSLDFSSNTGIFTIVKGDSFTVETNLSTFGWEITDDCLKIENNVPTNFMSFDDAAVEIIVTIPERHFKEVKLSLNAGEFYADDIITDKLTIDMDAGEAVLNNISAITASNITINAGTCTLNNSVLNEAEINMDAGEMIFEESKLTGENDINLDFGEISMTLLGKRSDYKFDIDNDLGEVNVDGVPYNGELATTTIIITDNGDGAFDSVEPVNPIGTININLDLGECNIDFMEE